MSNYLRRQARAKRQLKRYDQGTLVYVAKGVTSGDPWNPVAGSDTEYPLDGVVKGVSQEYVDGTYVIASDLQATVAVFDVVPSVEGLFKIDGKTHQIKRVDPMPAAGTPVSWRIIIGS